MKQLGQLLLERGWVTDHQLAVAIRRQQELGGSLGTCLLETGAVSEEMLLQVLQDQYEVPAVTAAELRDLPPDVVRMISPDQAARHRAIPLGGSEQRAQIAITCPSDLEALDDLAFALGKTVQPRVITEVRLVECLARYYGAECPVRLRHLLDRLDANASRLHGSRWKRAAEPATSEPPPERVPDRPIVEAEIDLPTPLPDPRRPVPTPPADLRRALHLSREERDALIGATPIPPTKLDPVAPPEKPPTSPPEPVSQDFDEDPTTTEILRRLAHARNAPEVAQILVEALRQSFDQVLLFQVRRGEVRGWKGDGGQVDVETLGRFHTGLDRPSIFHNLDRGGDFFLGTLPHMPAHDEIARILGRNGQGATCAVFPVRLAERMVLAAVGHCPGDGWRHLDLTKLQRITGEAGHALEACLTTRKPANLDRTTTSG